MAMHMQDAMSFEMVKEGSSDTKKRLSGSLSTTKAECIFNPKSADPNRRWRSGDWLVEKLIPSNHAVDVVTIVGPLAHGKSHSLNTRIFRDVLSMTSKKLMGFEPLLFDVQHDADGQGTVGVWAAFHNYEKFLVFDTQGFYEKPLADVAERDPSTVCAVRNAVKLMAMSDTVIFHTQTPRIDPNETFRFLQEASVIMEDRLRPAIRRKTKPALIVFHQVSQEHPLDSHKFRTLLGESVCNAFGDVQYFPVVRTTEEDFGALNAAITQEQSALRRSTRDSIKEAFNTLFSPETEWTPVTIEDNKAIVPVELFACPFKCLACGKSCCLLQHSENKLHEDSLQGSQGCLKFVETLKNRAFICRKCNVEASVTGYSPDDYGVVRIWKYYTQSANMINCPNCKTIYRSDEGVWPPDEKCPAVETRIWHIWDVPNRIVEPTPIGPTVFYSRALLDPLVDATDSFVSIFKPKVQTVQKYLLDNVRPDYWVPDDSATQCKTCSVALPDPGLKHHCRQCGDIFCDSCSSRRQPVPERGWGEKPVRVCNRCFGTKLTIPVDGDSEAVVVKETSVKGRWFYEQVTRVVGAVETAGSYVAETLVNQTMPDYWQKDTEPGASVCNCCHQPFEKSQAGAMQDSSTGMSASSMGNGSGGGGDLKRHHCRQCGKFVCGSCSPFRTAVPERGWGDRPVRVCNNCFTSKSSSSNQQNSASSAELAQKSAPASSQ